MTSVEITFEDDPYEISVRVEHPLTEHALDKAEDLLHALGNVDDDATEERIRGIASEEFRAWARVNGPIPVSHAVRCSTIRNGMRCTGHVGHPGLCVDKANDTHPAATIEEATP